MSSPWKTLNRRINQREMIVESLPQIRNAIPQLSTVRSCAMLGCGRGYIDLEFVRGCLPSVERLAAVEPEADPLDELATRVGQLLPNVSSTEFHQETFQSWKVGDHRFDAVTLFHCLYYIPKPERFALFQKLFDNVVASGGLVFVLIAPYDIKNCTAFDRLKFRIFGESAIVDGIQVSDMMTSVGFCECYQLKIKSQVSMTKPYDDWVALFTHVSEGVRSCEEFSEMVNELVGSEETIPYENWLGVFKKP